MVKSPSTQVNTRPSEVYGYPPPLPFVPRYTTYQQVEELLAAHNNVLSDNDMYNLVNQVNPDDLIEWLSRGINVNSVTNSIGTTILQQIISDWQLHLVINLIDRLQLKLSQQDYDHITEIYTDEIGEYQGCNNHQELIEKWSRIIVN